MTVITRAPSSAAGVGADAIRPVYTTGAFLNIGSDLEPIGLTLSVVSIPASRLAMGIDAGQVVEALTAQDSYSAESLAITGEKRFLGDGAMMAGLAWAVTAAGVRAADRRDLDPTPGDLDSYAATSWADLSGIERELWRLADSPLFIVENSPATIHSAATVAAGGMATALFTAGHLSAATIILAPIGIFLMVAAPTAGRAFGEYLEDLIHRLPGSGGER